MDSSLIPVPTPPTPTTPPPPVDPAPGAKPTLANTGPVGSLTTVTGDLRLQTAGASLSGLYVTGDVYHERTGVSLTDCRIDGNVYLCSAPQGNPSSTRTETLSLKRCSIGKAIGNFGGFGGLTVDACQMLANNMVHIDVTDAVGYTAKNLVVKNSFIRGRMTRYSGDPHWEIIHTRGIDGLIIQNNVLDMEATNNTGPDNSWSHITAVINLDYGSDIGNPNTSNGTIAGNWINGGGYFSIYPSLKGGSITDNTFTTGAIGALEVSPTPGPGSTFTQSGNTFNGQPVTLAV